MQNKTRKKDAVAQNHAGRCPIRYALNMIGGKWKMQIICLLSRASPARYGYIKKHLDGITPMMLSQTLKELEAGGLISRRQYDQIPPRVEYALTDKGQSLLPVLRMMSEWGKSHMEDYDDCDDTCGRDLLP